MPIYTSKDLIPFVNQLETKLGEVQESLVSWSSNQFKVINTVNRVDGIYANALQALVKADEALSEIGTATFTSTAARGKRLEDTLKKLKKDIFTSIENGDIVGIGGGGGGELTEGMFYDELNNAIADIDPTIEDGLKLDYRLRKIQEMASKGSKLSEQDIWLPHKLEAGTLTDTNVLGELHEGERFVSGEVTILTADLMPATSDLNEFIEGTIDDKGNIVLNHIPSGDVFLYYPVEIDFNRIPKDFVFLFFDMLLDKSSPLMKTLVSVEKELKQVQDDLVYMKGERWTPDFSIMRNHQDLIKEAIAPKGVYVNVKDGKSTLSFSFSDHPMLSHFVAEVWNEDEKRYVPANEDGGKISK